VGVTAEKLAIHTPADEFFGVCQSRRPIEPRFESLPDQRARRNMVPTRAFVDLLEYFFAFFCMDTLHELPNADPHLYRLSPTRTYPLLRLNMRAVSALFLSTPEGSLCSWMKSIKVIRQST
jgi:hypothetical protein